MNKSTKHTALALGALALAVWGLKMRGHPSVASVPPAGVDPFVAPYGWQTPGIADDPVILNGGAPFQSTVNVTVNPSYLGTLSQQFIPLFGFVGLGVDPAQQGGTAAGSSGANSGGTPTRLVAPPPAPSAFVSTAPSIAPDPFNQPAPVTSARNVSTGGSGGYSGGTSGFTRSAMR